MLNVKFEIGDIVKMKKIHPCGSYEWEITRTGIDFGLKCTKCGRFVMLPRDKFERAAKMQVKKTVIAEGANENEQ